MAAAGADGGEKGPRWYGGPFAWLARLHHEVQRRLQAAGRAGVAVAVEGAVDVPAVERVFERGFESEMAADAPVGHQVGHAVGREGVAVDVLPAAPVIGSRGGRQGRAVFRMVFSRCPAFSGATKSLANESGKWMGIKNRT